MKYKIKEISKDALNNLTAEVEYVDGTKKASKTFNFAPDISKKEILERINNGSNLPELTTEEKEKETICELKITEMTSEIDKEITIIKKEIKL